MTLRSHIAAYTLIGFNVLVLLVRLGSNGYHSVRPSVEVTPDFSWLAHDYPSWLPMQLDEPVAMSLQETSHFGIFGNDSISQDEWGTLFHPNISYGRFRLGAPKRAFVVSMFHQLHCIQIIEESIRSPMMAMEEHGHSHHCINYIRQTLLCKAADSLEPGDFLARNYSEGNDRYAGELACQDWTKLWDYAYQNTADYKQWTAQWN